MNQHQVNRSEDIEVLTTPSSDDVPVDALEHVSLDLPDSYKDEIYATQLLQAITDYHAAEAARRASRHQGDHQNAERLGKQAAICRTLAAIIQHEYPNTIKLYKQLALARVAETQRKRDQIAN